MLYFTVGNPSPDLDGSQRAGDNLFTNSILALDIKTGQRRWHFQEVHHDIWDYDTVSPNILFDVDMGGGRVRKGIAQAGKTGWVYLLDRETGQPLVGIDEKDVPQNANQKNGREAACAPGGWVRAATVLATDRQLPDGSHLHALPD
jgi:glucose dehydrogenase